MVSSRLFSILNEVVSPEACIDTRAGFVVIEDKNTADEQCRSVKISRVNGRYFLFSLDDDNIGRLSNYTHPQNQFINKKCDAVAFVAAEGGLHILYFELKSGSKSFFSDAKAQILNARLFVQYLIQLVKWHYGVSIDGYKEHCFVFTTRPIGKSTTMKKKIAPRIVDGLPYFVEECNKTINLAGYKLD